MKLAFVLVEAGFPADVIETSCTVSLGDNAITNSHLSLKAKIGKISKEEFQKLAVIAMDTCPISQSLKTEITMDAFLVS